MTEPATIRRWLEETKEKKATHMFVVTDNFDYTDYPVPFTGTPDEARAAAEKYPRNMQKLMEVYDLNMDFDEQLKQFRAFNY
jgi:hypothetical protein